MTNLKELSDYYENTEEKNAMVFAALELVAKSNDYLWKHRMYIEEHKLGWGERSFHGMWSVIIDSMPRDFKFLEIGIYKGQVLSLVSMLSKNQGRDGLIYGISPLSAVGDKYWTAPESDYPRDIQNLFNEFNLNYDKVSICRHLSTDSEALEFGAKNAPFDIVYIDGGHDYEVVKSDILNYGALVKKGGLLVMDDASSFLNLPKHINSGLTDVSNAVKDYLESNHSFVNILNCGHNRIFKKL